MSEMQYAADIMSRYGVSRRTADRYMDEMPCVYIRPGKRCISLAALEGWEKSRARVKAEEKPARKPKTRQRAGQVTSLFEADGRLKRR